MTVTFHTTAGVVWRASSVAHGLERHELGEKLSTAAWNREKGREEVELVLEPAEAEFVRVVGASMCWRCE